MFVYFNAVLMPTEQNSLWRKKKTKCNNNNINYYNNQKKLIVQDNLPEQSK